MAYAAKAKIKHAMDDTTLKIWLTFNLPMNQKIKPANTVWLVYLDNVLTAITSSAWVDAFTMLLQKTSMTTIPGKVEVAFNGPDGNLETTWHKNWEPWGKILSEPYAVGMTTYMAYLNFVGDVRYAVFVGGLLVNIEEP